MDLIVGKKYWVTVTVEVEGRARGVWFHIPYLGSQQTATFLWHKFDGTNVVPGAPTLRVNHNQLAKRVREIEPKK
jgi:hypothetical protein